MNPSKLEFLALFQILECGDETFNGLNQIIFVGTEVLDIDDSIVDPHILAGIRTANFSTQHPCNFLAEFVSKCLLGLST